MKGRSQDEAKKVRESCLVRSKLARVGLRRIEKTPPVSASAPFILDIDDNEVWRCFNGALCHRKALQVLLPFVSPRQYEFRPFASFQRVPNHLNNVPTSLRE
jgi:hypothetical protein